MMLTGDLETQVTKNKEVQSDLSTFCSNLQHFIFFNSFHNIVFTPQIIFSVTSIHYIINYYILWNTSIILFFGNFELKKKYFLLRVTLLNFAIVAVYVTHNFSAPRRDHRQIIFI